MTYGPAGKTAVPEMNHFISVLHMTHSFIKLKYSRIPRTLKSSVESMIFYLETIVQRLELCYVVMQIMDGLSDHYKHQYGLVLES